MRGPTGPRWRAAAAAIAAAALLGGCVWKPPTNPPPAQPATKFKDEARRVQAATPDKVPWFCNGSGHGTPAGTGHGNGSHVDPAYEHVTKGPLSWDDCHKMAAQLDQTLGYTRGLETRGKAEAAGFTGFGGYIAGLGTHHGKLADLVDQTYNPNAVQTFDPAKPTFLIYGGRGADAPLVGAAWRVAGNAPRPPEGFVGQNDWYHKHSSFCSVGAVAEEVSPEDCRARGGQSFTIPGGGDYLLHLWLNQPYEYRPDLFVSGHPCLLTNGVAPQTDPCWQARRSRPVGDRDAPAARRSRQPRPLTCPFAVFCEWIPPREGGIHSQNPKVRDLSTEMDDTPATRNADVIVDVVTEILETEGYDAVRLREVARRSHLSPPHHLRAVRRIATSSS